MYNLNFKVLPYLLLPSINLGLEDGKRTLNSVGILKTNPSLSEPEHIKYAVFEDKRFLLKRFYKQFIPFLPKEFEVIGGPHKFEDCFGYVCSSNNISFTKKELTNGGPLKTFLIKRGFRELSNLDEILKDDLIVYKANIDNEIKDAHVAIYDGDMFVKSRWGDMSPVIKHPANEVTSYFWTGRNKDVYFMRNPKNK